MFNSQKITYFILYYLLCSIINLKIFRKSAQKKFIVNSTEVFQVKTVCLFQEPAIIPVTFLTSNSYAILTGYEGQTTMNVTFSFRTFEESGLLVFHKFTSFGHVKVRFISN